MIHVVRRPLLRWRISPSCSTDPRYAYLLPSSYEGRASYAGRAYNRTTYAKQRTAMMQTWADYFDELAAGGAVVALLRA